MQIMYICTEQTNTCVVYTDIKLLHCYGNNQAARKCWLVTTVRHISSFWETYGLQAQDQNLKVNNNLQYEYQSEFSHHKASYQQSQLYNGYLLTLKGKEKFRSSLYILKFIHLN